jgi:hypothetical protein
LLDRVTTSLSLLKQKWWSLIQVWNVIFLCLIFSSVK